MGKKLVYTSGQKYHRSPDGMVRPCHANIRTCQYQDHFDTYDDAMSNRQTVSNNVQPSDVIKFNNVIGDKNITENELGEPVKTLRDFSEEAKRTYFKTGRMPQSPIGETIIPLPGDQKITLKRESYDRNTNVTGVGTRYVMRYFSDPKHYEQSIIEFNNKIEFEAFTKKLDEYFTTAHDTYISTHNDKADFVSPYQKTLQSVSEVEAVSRGADKSYMEFGIDIFSHENPGELTLDVDYDNSAIQSYDITSALRGHAATDENQYDVTIHVKGSMGGQENYWQMDRLPEGVWLVGANSSKGVVSQAVRDSKQASKFIMDIMYAHGESDARQKQIGEYVSQVMNEVDSSVQSYQSTVAAKQAERKEKSDRYKRLASYADKGPILAEEKPQSFTRKLGKLFS